MTESWIDRIKDRGQQARSLLSPWLRASADPAGEDSGALPLGERRRAAARSMRVLDDQKLGAAHPKSVLNLGAGYSEKLQSIQSMLHFRPNIRRDGSIWSSVDQVHPAAPAAEAPREPEQPGVMRAGTVIQKFSMTPQPGQSISSFKEQVAKLPQSKSAPRKEKPVLPERARLFSRVQEISGNRPPEENNPVEPDQPDTSPSSQPAALDEVPPPPESPGEGSPPSPPAPASAGPSPSAPPPVALKPASPRLVETTSEPELPAPDAAPRPEPPPAVDSVEHAPGAPVEPPAQAAPPATQATLVGDTPSTMPLRAKRIAASKARPQSPPSAPRLAQAASSGTEKPAPPAAKSGGQVQRQVDAGRKPAVPSEASAAIPASALPDRPTPAPTPRPAQSRAVQRPVERPQDAPRQQPAEQKAATPRPTLPPLRLPQAQPVASRMAEEDASSPTRYDEQAPPAFSTPPMPLENRLASGAPPARPAVTLEPPASSGTPAPLPAALPVQQSSPAQLAQQAPAAVPPSPLQARLVERRSAARARVPAAPDALRQLKARPAAPDRPALVSRQKYAYTPPGASPPSLQAPHRTASGAPATSPTVQRQPEPQAALPPPAPQQAPVSLVLAAAQPSAAASARTAPTPASAAPAPGPAPRAEKSESPRQKPGDADRSPAAHKEPTRGLRPTHTGPNGVVQRRWDEHSGPEAVARAQSTEPPEPQIQSVDLDQLASDVLPLVKRLLEIEIERSMGSY